MSEPILSNDEVEVLTKAVERNADSLSDIFEQVSSERRYFERMGHSEILDCILSLFYVEAGKNFSSFLRKKVDVSISSSRFGTVGEFVSEDDKETVYNLYYVTSGNYFSVVSIKNNFLHQILNVLFGGYMNTSEPISPVPGKIGLMVSEKVASTFLAAFKIACSEYGEFNYQLIKTSTLPVLVSRLSKDHRIYAISIDIAIDDNHFDINMLVNADFMRSLSTEKLNEEKATDDKHAHVKDKIKNSLMNSNITLVASLPESKINAMNLMCLKAGDLIPISNPTNVVLSVGNKKLFSGIASQSNSSLVVKLIDKLSE